MKNKILTGMVIGSLLFSYCKNQEQNFETTYSTYPVKALEYPITKLTSINLDLLIQDKDSSWVIHDSNYNRLDDLSKEYGFSDSEIMAVLSKYVVPEEKLTKLLWEKGWNKDRVFDAYRNMPGIKADWENMGLYVNHIFKGNNILKKIENGWIDKESLKRSIGCINEEIFTREEFLSKLEKGLMPYKAKLKIREANEKSLNKLIEEFHTDPVMAPYLWTFKIKFENTLMSIEIF